ncbi:uncharacterized protein [Rutidosis leptorrhynchoides]|uniref:uncharacterized protein n=1 Tax=Rutidosis leptorrhynchoides TaxID=125765 RepID=UPI003A9A28B2
MKRGSWILITSPDFWFDFLALQSLYLSGTLYWFVSGCVTELSTEMTNYIVTFNLSTHVFGKILLPKHSSMAKRITIYNGSLAFVSNNRCKNLTFIWVMREYNNVASWSLIHRLKPEHVYQCLQPIANGDILFYSVTWYQVYHHKTGMFSKVFKLGRCYRLRMETYMESLELLDTGSPCGRSIFVSDEKEEA